MYSAEWGIEMAHLQLENVCIMSLQYLLLVFIHLNLAWKLKKVKYILKDILLCLYTQTVMFITTFIYTYNHLHIFGEKENEYGER